MNLVNTNDTARTWSERLGNLAAESPPINTKPVGAQIDAPGTFSARLSALLQRNRRQERAADKLRTQEFLAGT